MPSTKEPQVYECTNKACLLGTVGNPGHFTGGATAEGINMMTGTPVENLKKGTHFGEGVCPNCGSLGRKV